MGGDFELAWTTLEWLALIGVMFGVVIGIVFGFAKLGFQYAPWIVAVAFLVWFFQQVEDMKYDDRHGGPYDRGGADSYYRRGFNPHYYSGATMQSEEIPEALMTTAEVEAYRAGYKDNEDAGDFKDWG